MKNDRGLSICQCCAFCYDIKGKRFETGLGKEPVVTQFCDPRGWWVICPDCGIEVMGLTKEEAFNSWNTINRYNEVSNGCLVIHGELKLHFAVDA